MSETQVKEPSETEGPHLALKHPSADEHTRALVGFGKLPFWWYQGASRLFGNRSLPFLDHGGAWWYELKPGLCWPVYSLQPTSAGQVSPPYSKSYCGFQRIVAEGAPTNSHLVINAIFRLDSYGAARIPSTRRKSMRRGLRGLRCRPSCGLRSRDV